MTPPPPASDSTRQRILDAAVACFARDGFACSVRTIAAEAGVSAALVIHHFTDKSGLRRACDDAALHAVTHKGEPDDEVSRRMLAEHLAPHVRYIARALIEGGDSAAAFFDALIASSDRILDTAGMLAGASADAREDARVALTAYSLAPLLLGGLIARRFGHDEVDADVLLRLDAGLAAVAPLLGARVTR
ncbi:TetR family transcriptional regulator [Microbacterium sp. ET2]|uniref:TetR/AcrR family transcriptional regulator n=1 Tax=Microbacterium albipurpureum TaxID=3050384 RepID=UPI00259CAA4C|nr:TetR/AcrR family transcriptional regulator [Microbacterium sp. ET2 (Ac-2212)]WJL94362.1 TetR family transcriptional regulator [Microbacterium sp. ET2 (Ac-2212)]